MFGSILPDWTATIGGHTPLIPNSNNPIPKTMAAL
jgi:hypothetical protein